MKISVTIKIIIMMFVELVNLFICFQIFLANNLSIKNLILSTINLLIDSL